MTYRTDFDVKQELAEQALEADRRQTISETTPQSISDKTLALCQAIGSSAPLFVPVITDRFGLYRFCNSGVKAKVSADGGTISFGWCIWEYPRLFLEAEFHAVWRDKEGSLFDITPKPQMETRILFSEDVRYGEAFDFDRTPSNFYRRIYEPQDRLELAAQKLSRLSSGQTEYETKRGQKKSLTLLQWLEQRMPIDRLPDRIEDFLQASRDYDAIFTLQGDGMVADGKEYKKRAEVKMKTLLAMKSCIARETF